MLRALVLAAMSLAMVSACSKKTQEPYAVLAELPPAGTPPPGFAGTDTYKEQVKLWGAVPVEFRWTVGTDVAGCRRMTSATIRRTGGSSEYVLVADTRDIEYADPSGQTLRVADQFAPRQPCNSKTGDPKDAFETIWVRIKANREYGTMSKSSHDQLMAMNGDGTLWPPDVGK